MIWSYQIAFDCCDDPERAASFWRRALRYQPDEVPAEAWEWIRREHPDWIGTRSVAEDEARRHPRLYLQRVPEAKAGRNRIRFEVAVPAGQMTDEQARFELLGARRAGGDEMADPEGNEFAIIGGDDLCFNSVVVDAVDPHAQAAFWRSALSFPGEGPRCDPAPGYLKLVDGELIAHGQTLARLFPAGSGRPERVLGMHTPSLVFVSTDAPKGTKNRIHFDVNCVDRADWDAERERLLAIGASTVDPEELHLPEMPPEHPWMVLRDPEGNEFCLQAALNRPGS